jgi:hypothetical protein
MKAPAMMPIVTVVVFSIVFHLSGVMNRCSYPLAKKAITEPDEMSFIPCLAGRNDLRWRLPQDFGKPPG